MTSSPAPDLHDRPVVATTWPARAQGSLLAITALAVIVRLFRVEQWSLDAAEAATWRAITMPLAGADGFFATDASRAPLVPLVLRWLVENVMPGTGEGWLRLPFAFVGALSVPLLGVFAARHLGVPAALASAALLAVHPWHVAASQTAAPLVAGVAVALAAGCAFARSRVVAVIAAFVAVATASPCWVVLALVAAVKAPIAWRPRARQVTALLAAPVWLVANSAFGLPVVMFAALGLWLAPNVVVFAATLPTLGIAAWNVLQGAPLATDMLIVLPGVVLLASCALVAAFVSARERLPGSLRLRTVAAALPATLVGVWLAVEVFLYATAWQGGRTPWRLAARTVLIAVDGPDAFAVAAIAGAEPLRFYLRPGHFAAAGHDAHPGVTVVPLPANGFAAALAAFGADAAVGRRWLVLRTAEHHALTAEPEVATQLQREFRLHRVLQNSGARGDDSLLVFRHDPAR